MPLHVQTDPASILAILRVIFSQPRPPVARGWLPSSGNGPGRKFNVTKDFARNRAYLGYESCMENCPVMVRDPKHRLRTVSRSSITFGILVEEFCVNHGNNVAFFPQVDTSLNYLFVQTHLAEVMVEMLVEAESEETVDHNPLKNYWLPAAGDLA